MYVCRVCVYEGSICDPGSRFIHVDWCVYVFKLCRVCTHVIDAMCSSTGCVLLCFCERSIRDPGSLKTC